MTALWSGANAEQFVNAAINRRDNGMQFVIQTNNENSSTLNNVMMSVLVKIICVYDAST